MNGTPVESHGFVRTVLDLPIFRADWVLWFLLATSLASIAIMIERAWFYRKKTFDLVPVRRAFTQALQARDYAAAARVLEPFDTLETNVALYALREHDSGPDAVEDLVLGVGQKERERYDDRLSWLATIASNAPFVGLFGTVLGIIRAFNDLASSAQNASTAVMAGVAEALVATAVGLLVAIPALVAFNVFKRRVKLAMNNAQLLSRILLAHMKSLA